MKKDLIRKPNIVYDLPIATALDLDRGMRAPGMHKQFKLEGDLHEELR
jgi:hypothetical protein